MTIRKIALGGALAVSTSLAAVPAPALAQNGRAAEVAERLNDPMTQYAVAGMLSAMSKAVLDMKVAPFLDAMEGMGGKSGPDLGPDATVADLGGIDPAQVREEMVERVPQMMSAMGAMAGALQEMLPQFKAMAEKMKDAVPRS